MLNEFVLQEAGGPSSLLLLLPLLLCCMIPLLTRMYQKPSQAAAPIEIDTWFTSYRIDEAFEAIKNYVSGWRKQAAGEVNEGRGFPLFKPKPPPERFVTSESAPPRLIKFSDPIEGSLTFELTETELGGTAIRVNYHPNLRGRVQKMRAAFPLKIPFAAGSPCSGCGRPLLPDFKLCPYCGQKTK